MRLGLIVTAGLIMGWQGVAYGLSQPWWPWSVSGQPETVVSGILVTNPSGDPTGLMIQSANQDTAVDISRMPVGTANRYLNRQVKARGEVIDSALGTYLLISWLK